MSVHEYSMVEALLARVEQEARAHGARTVRRLEVRIGELAGVEVELFKTAYATFRAGTSCAAAELALSPVPALWLCPRCEQVIAKGAPLQCPRCQVAARLSRGDEIVLDRVELEVADV